MPVPPTVWWTEPGAYRAQCETVAGANVLMLSSLRMARRWPRPSPTAEWGLHLLDVGVGLGDLIGIVKDESGRVHQDTSRDESLRALVRVIVRAPRAPFTTSTTVGYSHVP